MASLTVMGSKAAVSMTAWTTTWPLEQARTIDEKQGEKSVAEDSEAGGPPLKNDSAGPEEGEIQEEDYTPAVQAAEPVLSVEEQVEEDMHSLELISSTGTIHTYRNLKKLGQGGFGRAYLSQRVIPFSAAHVYHPPPTAPLVVLKCFKHDDHATQERDMALHYCRGLSPRIVRLLDACLSPPSPGVSKHWLQYELSPYGDLWDFHMRMVSRHTTPHGVFTHQFPESLILHIARQLCEALAFLHSGHVVDAERGIGHDYADAEGNWEVCVHQDIKPGNILLQPGRRAGYPDIRLADFGLAHLADDDEWDNPGTDGWMPPPGHWQFGTGADMWGLGAVVYFLATGDTPEYWDPVKKEWVLLCYDVTKPSNEGFVYTDRLQGLLERLLTSEDSERAVACDLLGELEREPLPLGKEECVPAEALVRRDQGF